MMARIRTVKPELFEHEELFDCGQRVFPGPGGALVTLVYQELWCLADREGRLLWRPRTVLRRLGGHYEREHVALAFEALVSDGFVVVYEATVSEKPARVAWIPSFRSHQIPNSKEAQSKLPPFLESSAISMFSELRIPSTAQAQVFPEKASWGTGREREREQERNTREPAAPRALDSEPILIREDRSGQFLAISQLGCWNANGNDMAASRAWAKLERDGENMTAVVDGCRRLAAYAEAIDWTERLPGLARFLGDGQWQKPWTIDPAAVAKQRADTEWRRVANAVRLRPLRAEIAGPTLEAVRQIGGWNALGQSHQDKLDQFKPRFVDSFVSASAALGGAA